MEDREGNGVGFEIEFGLTGRRRRPFFGEVRGKATQTEEVAKICCLSRANSGEKAAKKGKPSEIRCF